MKFSAVTFVFFINFIVLFDGALSGQTLSLVPLEWKPKLLLISKSFNAHEWAYIQETLYELKDLADLVDETLNAMTQTHGKVVPEAVRTFIGDPNVMIQQGGIRLSQMSNLCQSYEHTESAISEVPNVVNILHDESSALATKVVNQGGDNKANLIILGRGFFAPRIPPTEKLYYIAPTQLLLRDTDVYKQAKAAFKARKRAGRIKPRAVFTNFPMPVNPAFQLLRALQYSDAIMYPGLLPKNDDFNFPRQAASPGVTPLHERALNWAIIALLAHMDKRRLRVKVRRVKVRRVKVPRVKVSPSIHYPSDFLPIEGLHH